MKTLALLLALSSTALASEDVGSVMASLNDQKAECRYLLEICGEYVGAETLAHLAMMPWGDAIALAERKRGEITTAAGIMKGKREKMPACVAECVGPSGEKLLEPW